MTTIHNILLLFLWSLLFILSSRDEVTCLVHDNIPKENNRLAFIMISFIVFIVALFIILFFLSKIIVARRSGQHATEITETEDQHDMDTDQQPVPAEVQPDNNESDISERTCERDAGESIEDRLEQSDSSRINIESLPSKISPVRSTTSPDPVFFVTPDVAGTENSFIMEVDGPSSTNRNHFTIDDDFIPVDHDILNSSDEHFPPHPKSSSFTKSLKKIGSFTKKSKSTQSLKCSSSSLDVRPQSHPSNSNQLKTDSDPDQRNGNSSQQEDK